MHWRLLSGASGTADAAAEGFTRTTGGVGEAAAERGR